VRASRRVKIDSGGMPEVEAEAPSTAQMTERLERVLGGSPAAATELVWIETRRGRETTGKRRREAPERRDSMVLLRVREAGRTGVHRTVAGDFSELENALRDALAHARLAAPSAGCPLAPSAASPLAPSVASPHAAGAPLAAGTGSSLAAGTGPAPQPELFDAEVARLDPGRARERLQRLAERDESICLSWAEIRMAVVNSSGLRCAARATVAAIEASCGRAAGAGSAAAAARSWQRLAPEEVVERARRRHAPAGALAEVPAEPVPLVLSQEAAAALLGLLNRHALSSTSFRAGASLLRQNLGNQVFHPAIGVRDDGTDPRGLPFPWDLFGWPTRPIDLIAAGVVLTPAVDPELAAALGRLPTPHQVAPDEWLANHLFLLPGAQPDDELMRKAGGGLWIGALEPVECFAPAGLRFRAVARGVRRLEGGSLGAAVPDLVWEDGLASVFSRVLGVGTDAVSVQQGDDLFGATTAPLVALEPGAALHPLLA
jgi:predicted Zn-dependent protease